MMFSCDRHQVAGFGQFCPDCVKELTKLNASTKGDGTKPAAPEWDGEGLPPEGYPCEALWLELPDGGSRDFEWVIVKAYSAPKVWFQTKEMEEVVVFVSDCKFRPLRTKKQRERDELSKLVREAYLEGASEHVGGLIAITDAILSKYNLEPKP